MNEIKNKRRSKQIPQRNFQIGDTEIEWENNAVKYLGVFLDRRLTLKHHLDFVLKKVNLATKTLYSMLNRKSKLNLTCKTLLYKVALCPIMTYAAPLLSQASSSNRKRLKVAQNKLLRMIQDVPRYTYTQQIH